MPVAGDYDGDGIADLTVFRPSTGQWFVLRSSSHFTTSFAVGWGATGDIPVSAPSAAAAGEEAPSPRRQRGSGSKATRSGERRETATAGGRGGRSAAGVAPANGIGTTLLYGAGGALVIAGGALAGLALRRRRG